MTKEQYAEMLKDIGETHKNGGDVSACIAKYRARYKYMYIYNDIVFKVLFGTPENEKITVAFLNRLIIGTVFVSKIRKMKFFTRLFALLQEKAKLSIQVYL